MRARLTLICLAFVLAVGGCGGSASEGGADPAEYAPADTAIYIEAVVRPEGEQGDAARSVAGKLLDTKDPGARIRELVDEAMRKSDGPKATFDEDIDPWLGGRVGMALSDLSQDEPRYVVALASRDEDAAAEQVAQEARDEKARRVTSGDVDYWVDPEGEVAGAVDDAVLFASDEKTFKRALAAKDGEHLAGSKAYEAALDALPEERIGTFYFDTKRFFDAAIATGGGDPASEAIMRRFAGDLRPAGAALVAGDDTLTIESASPAPSSPLGKLFGASTGGATPLLRELPAGTWGAVGIPDAGAGAKALVGTVGGALGGAFIDGQLKQLGVDLDQDVYSWIGDVALFARGDSIVDIRGGAVIEVTDRDRAAKAIPKLIGLARQQGEIPFEPTRVPGAELAFRATEAGMPEAVVVALGSDRAVITYGEDAAAQALEPDATIDQDGLYDRAKSAVGLDPALLFDAPAIVKLISEGAPAEDFAEAEPYLDGLELVAAGSERDGDRLRQRFVVKLR